MPDQESEGKEVGASTTHPIRTMAALALILLPLHRQEGEGLLWS